MVRSVQFPSTIELPTSLARWAAGFDVKVKEKEPLFVPRPAGKVAYEAVSVPPRSVWKPFLTLPLSNLRPVHTTLSTLQLAATERVSQFVEDYGPLTRSPLTDEAPPDVAPLSEWRELQAEVRAVHAAFAQKEPDSAEQDVLRRFVDIIDAVPHTLRVGDLRRPRPHIAYRSPDLRTMIWLGQLQDRIEGLSLRQCLQCPRWFEAFRRDHKYCSAACRVERARGSSPNTT